MPLFMKRVILFVLIFCAIIGSCTQEKKSPNEGVWKVVSWERTVGDSISWKLPGNFTGSETKIVSNNHFLWVGRYKRDSTYLDNYGGGTCSLDGNHLEESIQYSASQSDVGSKVKLIWELKNDTATQTWPCDENWQINKNHLNIQKWVRIK